MLEEFIRKPLSEWEASDLDRLVDGGAREDDRLEFKSEMYGNNDEPTREMLRDVTALANHQGGYLLIGVNENGDGVASDIPGVLLGDHDERLRASLRSNVTPRLNGLEVVIVPYNAAGVVVIHVPFSYTRPHMVTFKGLNQFWKRHGREKNPMAIDEIQFAFERRLEGQSKMDSFVTARKRHAQGLVPSEAALFLYATPALPDQALVDIHDERIRLLMNSDSRAGAGAIGVGAHLSPARPSLDGLKAADSDSYRRYLSVHRSGHVEYFSEWGWHKEGTNLMFPPVVAGTIFDFVLLVEEIYALLGAVVPMVFGIVLTHPDGIGYPRRSNSDETVAAWSTPVLDVPAIFEDHLAGNGRMVAADLANHLWNAFGFEKCQYFDVEGEFKDVDR
ncbi:MAG: ATP-binding protein [Chloroflexi bacterium]|nr:ATP-binding protein [Chloroflexota bacterium]